MDQAIKKRCFQPIRVVYNTLRRKEHRMFTIARIPRCLSRYFTPQKQFFSKPAWPHFWGLVVAIAMGTEHTLDRLNRLLRKYSHRTNNGEFLWRSHWDESQVLRNFALQMFAKLYRLGEPIYFFVDETQTLKRAKKMDAVGKLYHHATGQYGSGHTILKACLCYRGVTIPFGYTSRSRTPAS